MTSTFDLAGGSRRVAIDGPTMVVLAGAAIAFNAGGALHPDDNGTGNKVVQLHDMLLQSTWWPSHLALLSSFALFTAGFLRIARRRQPVGATRRVLRAMVVVSGLTTAAMVPHLLAPLGADSISDGRSNALSIFMTIDETLADAPWAIGIALLALVAGVTHDLGNRLTAVVGMVGGASFAAAAVTIPFTDALDGLFAVGGTGITLWTLGIVAAGVWRRRQTDVPTGRTTASADRRLRRLRGSAGSRARRTAGGWRRGPSKW